LRWLDDVENDLRVVKVKRWRKKAQNREEWASVIKEAKVLKGRRAKEQASEVISMSTVSVRTFLSLETWQHTENC
jgi:hypothetical protein